VSLREAFVRQSGHGFNDFSIGDVGISWATLAELEFVVAKTQHGTQNKAALDDFLLPLERAVGNN